MLTTVVIVDNDLSGAVAPWAGPADRDHAVAAAFLAYHDPILPQRRGL